MNPASILRHPALWIAVVLVALSAVWRLLGAPVSLVTEIAIYTLYGAGVNLLVGYTGLVPFGASVFFGCASYAVAFLLSGLIGNDILALAFAVVFSLVLGLAIGALILRRKGLYFSLLTLAFSQIAFEVAYKWTAVTGGENGLQDLPRPTFATAWGFHAFVMVTVVIAMAWLWRIAHSPFGRVLQAIRDNETRASSLGYNVFLMRLGALTLMAGFVGYAGGLLTLLLQGVYANNLNWQHAGDSLLMTVLGGVHHFLGPLWGAVLFIVLQNQLSALTENWWLIFAPIIMVFALASPEGVHGLMQRLLKRERWTLTRNSIPPRPAVIKPYVSAAVAMDPARPILQAKGICKSFGSLVTASDIDLDVHPFVLHSIIGPNGAGKTTFFNMLAGVMSPTAGRVIFAGCDVTRLPMHARARMGMGRSFQILSVFINLTVFENVRVAVQARRPRCPGLWRDAHSFDDINDATWSILDAVGLTDRAADICNNLPHGAKRLLEIALTLATDPKILLFDEPLAGLAEADRIVVAKLIKGLSKKHAVLLIEHDIDRVVAISDRMTVLHQGHIIADGPPAEVTANAEVVQAYLGASGGDHHAPVAAAAWTAPQDAKPLLQVRKISGGYSGSTVISDLSLMVKEGEAVALLGRNGVGKTTALRAITGTLKLSGGDIVYAGRTISNLKPFEINRVGISLVPEGRRLFPNLTVVENLLLARRPGGFSLEEIFELFPRLHARQRAKAENLSGGERQMVAIARSLVVPSKLILLDEPFEGLAPAVVSEVMAALVKLRGRIAMLIVEHHSETVFSMVDRAYVLVNGRVEYEGDAMTLENDRTLQARLLGVVQVEKAAG